MPERIQRKRNYDDPKLKPYYTELRATGYERLIPMLDKEAEGTVLSSLEECLIQALNAELKKDPSKIRFRVEELMECSKLNNFLNIRIIPPEELFGLCGLSEQKIELTDIGRSIFLLKEAFPELFLFLFGGRSRELANIKPPYLRREKPLPIKSYRIPVMHDLRSQQGLYGMYIKQNIPPPDFNFDFDILATTSNKQFSLDDIVSLLRKSGFEKNKGGWVKISSSTRRPGFERVDFGITGYRTTVNESGKIHQGKGISLGHIFFPGNKGYYSQENLLIPFLMENTRVDIPILLVPYFSNGKWIIWGLALDFFNGFQDVAKHRLESQKWLGHPYSISFYPFPTRAFPKNSPSQTAFNLGYGLRTWSWCDQQPMMVPFTEDQLNNPDSRRKLIRKTQQVITNNVCYLLAEYADENRNRFGSLPQRLSAGLSLIEDIAQALDGDPIATILRLFPAGVSYTNLYPENWGTDIYGFGIFDKKGVFPQLGEIFDDQTKRDELVKRILIDMVEQRQKIGEKNKPVQHLPSGRKLFFDFLFETAEGNPWKALELLRPAWCDNKEWLRIIKKYLKRLIALDERFYELGDKKPKLSTKVLEIIQTTSKPLSSKEIAEQLNIHPSHAFQILAALERSGRIVRIGNKRGIRGEGLRGLGVGGSKAFFCNPKIADQFKNELKYMSPEDRILAILEQTDTPLNITQLIQIVSLSHNVVAAILKKLLEEGIVKTDKRVWWITKIP